MSFDTDTGLKQALATVSDYNPLMKDFPINDLLSATELERIRYYIWKMFCILTNFLSNKLMKIYIASVLKVGYVMLIF